MDKKYQIFISSTYTDLIKPREKVRDAILSMMHFPIGMEMFSAADEEQWEIIQHTIDSSDYYVLIVGQRYGSVIEEGPDAGISYTEKEFRYAREKKIPILAYILSDDADVKKCDIETDPEKIKKLDAFKTDVKTGRVVEWWSTPDELAIKFIAALHKQIDRKKRPGWIRCDSFSIERSHAEILELNKKVRELEAENSRLKSKVIERTPKLNVKFILDNSIVRNRQDKVIENECRSHGNLILKLDERGMQFKLASIDAENYRNRYKHLEKNCIDFYLQKYVTDEALQTYNNNLPSEDEIDQYIDKLKIYQRIHRGGVAFRLQLLNDGTAKASDVRAFVDFPKEFLVMDISDVKEVKEPKAPALPKNPIDEAERQYQRIMDPMTNIVQEMMKSTYPMNYSAFDSINSDFLAPNIGSINQSITINKRSIRAECRQLPHRDFEWFDGIYVIPTIKGKFQIKCIMMCSEYIEPEEHYIDIEVV
jgi:hypothetical protein